MMEEATLQYWIEEYQAQRIHTTVERRALFDALIVALQEARGAACRLFVGNRRLEEIPTLVELEDVVEDLPWLGGLFLL